MCELNTQKQKSANKYISLPFNLVDKRKERETISLPCSDIQILHLFPGFPRCGSQTKQPSAQRSRFADAPLASYLGIPDFSRDSPAAPASTADTEIERYKKGVEGCLRAVYLKHSSIQVSNRGQSHENDSAISFGSVCGIMQREKCLLRSPSFAPVSIISLNYMESFMII